MQQTNSVANDLRYASQDVGLIFVREYYTFLNSHPHKLHAFYAKDSYFLRGDEGETVPILHGQEEIRQKIEDLQFEDCKVLVTQVDSQASANNGIIVQVLGELCNRNGPSQKFSQTFFLAPQTNGYYVLNDIFRFLKDEVNTDYYTCEDEEVQHQQRLQEPEPQPQPQQEEPVKKVEEEEEEKEQEETAEPKVNDVEAAVAPVEEPKAAPAVETVKEEANVAKAAEVKENAAPKEAKKEVEAQVNGVAEANGSKKTAAPSKPKAGAAKTWAYLAANDSDKWADARAPAPASVAHPSAKAAQQPSQQPVQQPPPTQQPQQQQQQQQQQQPHQPPQQQQQQQQQQQHPQQQQQQQHPQQHQQQHGHQHNAREEGPSLQIYIKNVSPPVTEEGLREAFSAFGAVRKVNVLHGRNCAFLDFFSLEAVNKALAQNKVSVGGHTVLAEERRPGGRFQHNRQQQNGRPYERRFQDGHRRGGGPPRGKSRGGGPK